MNRSLIAPFLSFFVAFFAAAAPASAAAATHPVKHSTILSQTGGDPEPTSPPPNGGH